MILFLIEWIGTILVLLGIFFLNSKKASKPKTRFNGHIITIIGCLSLASFAYIIGSYGFMVTQIGVIIINFIGIHNCNNEMKRKDG